VIFFFVFQLIIPVLLLPKAANAQYIDPANLSMKIQEKIERATVKIKDSVWQSLFKGMMLTVSVSVKNLLVKMAKKAAEQTVTYMATGSWGQGSMFYESAWGDFKTDLQDQMVGQFLDNINDLFGIDLCHPALPDVELSLKMNLNIKYLEEGHANLKKPDCSLSELTNNWEALKDRVVDKYKDALAKVKDPYATSVAMLQETFSVSFTPSQSEMGGILTTQAKLEENMAKEVDAQEKQRLENQGAKGVTGVTGDTIKTPSFFTKSHSEAELEKAKETTKGEVEASGNVITEIPFQVAIAFLNTFVSQFWQQMIIDKYFKKGLVDPAKTYDPIQKVFKGKEAIEKELALTKINFSFAQKQIDLLGDFSSCGEYRGINNCVMDNSFAEAVRQASQDKPLSVREAIDLGYLDGTNILISSKDDRNLGDNCYAGNYCYSNLVKLRKARIIPIGWEIAADKVLENENVSLNEVISNFNNCEAPNASKFCHLIDPNWILRYPQTMCQAVVNGPLLIASGATERAESCADTESCIKMSDDGTCQAWGYCAAEKNVFRFNGQECQGSNNSCRTFINSKNKTVSYLKNTVEQKYCNEGNVGCLWYSGWKNIEADSWQWSDLVANRTYLNQKIIDQECDPKQEGCTRFIRTKPGLGTNLVANSSFEIFPGDDDPANFPSTAVEVPGWDGFHSLTEESYNGVAALELNDVALTSAEIPVVQKTGPRYFAVSAAINKQVSGDIFFTFITENDSNFAKIPLEPIADGQSFGESDVANWREISTVFEVKALSISGLDTFGFVKLQINSDAGSVYIDKVMVEELDEPDVNSRHAYNDYAAQNPVYLKKAPDYLNCYGAKYCYNPVDETYLNVGVVQEECNSDTDCVGAIGNHYKCKLYDPKPEDKVASTDTLKGCDKFAFSCSAEEVGCDSYDPSDGGNTIYGSSSYPDYCPQECAGYQSFSRTATFMEDSEFPIYFIPSTGQQCSAAQAGCEEYTNLDVMAEGGEAREYYIEPKLCIKAPENDSLCKNFYTWEGGEVTGYQLQAFSLKYDPENLGPALTLPSYADKCDKEKFIAKESPDCRQFFDEGGKAYYRLASKTIECSSDCHPLRRTLPFDTAEQCEYRLGEWQNGECIFMTIPSKGKKCTAPNAGCKEYRGNQAGIEFDVENYTFSDYKDIDNPLKKLIPSSATPYVSPEFGAYLAVSKVGSEATLFTNYETTELSGNNYNVSFWARSANSAAFNFEIRDGDNLISTVGFNQALTNDWSFFNFDIPASLLVNNGSSVGINATDSFDIDNLRIVKTEDLFYLIGNSWTTPKSCDYKLNTDLNDPVNALPQAQLGCREFQDKETSIHYLKSFTSLCPMDKVGCEAVVDTENNIYPFDKKYKQLISNEEVCVSASRNWSNVLDSLVVLLGNSYPPPQLMLGSTATGEAEAVGDKCEINVINVSGNSEVFDVELSHLCSQLKNIDKDYAGSAPEWSIDEKKCYDNLAIVPQDSLMYLVVDDKSTCDSSEKGCTALGLPDLTVVPADVHENDDPDLPILFYKGDYIVKEVKNKKTDTMEPSWNNMFYKLDPEKFEAVGSPLCGASETGCEEYSTKDGGPYYFKNPGDKICEYRKVAQGAEKVFGWYVEKTAKGDPDVPCVVKDYYEDGQKQPINTNDLAYSGWVGACEENADLCTAFVDPTDIMESAKGKAYYYLNNELVDKGTCSEVDRKQGCVLFNDTSITKADGNADLMYYSFDTYVKSTLEGKFVPAVTDKSTWYLSNQSDLDNLWQNKCLAIEDCKAMKLCLTRDKSPEECFAYVATDADPSLDGIQQWCDVGITGTDWEKNAAANCTALRLIKEKDTNSIIKVVKDRECANWFACSGSSWHWDENKGEYTEVCDELGLCSQLDEKSESTKCSKFIGGLEDTGNLLTMNKPLNGEKAIGDKTDYAGRGVGWFDFDYSGLSVPKLAPAQYYSAFDLSAPKKYCDGITPAVTCEVNSDCDDGVACKMFINKTCGGAVESTACLDDGDCSENIQCEKVVDFHLLNSSNIYCEKDDDCVDVSKPGAQDYCGTTIADNKCKCLSQSCVRSYQKGTELAKSPAPECRGYPEKESPFPWNVKDYMPFANANRVYLPLNNDGLAPADVTKKDVDLGCYYRKVTYGGGSITKYIPNSPLFSPDIPQGVCQNDPEKTCSSENCPEGAMGVDAVCNLQDEKMTQYSGWGGYCLEFDLSMTKNNNPDEHPCLTWYPTQNMAGLMDMYNQYVDAGFNPESYNYLKGGPYYCTTAKRWEHRTAPHPAEVKGWYDFDKDYKHVPPVYVLKKAIIGMLSTYATKYGIEELNSLAWEAGGPYGGEADWIEAVKWDKTNEDMTPIKKWASNGDPIYAQSGEEAIQAIKDNYVRLEKGRDKSKNWCISNSADPLAIRNCLGEKSGQLNDYYGGDFPPNPATACVEGYGAKYLYKLSGKQDWAWFDYQQKYTFSFLCVPMLENEEKTGEGWYQDVGGSISENLSEEEQQSCEQFYAMAGPQGENKAFTNEVYKNASLDCTQGRTLNGALPLDMQVSKVSSGPDKKPYNLFVDDETIDACVMGGTGTEGYYKGGNSDFTKDVLETWFAEAYGYWKMKVGIDDTVKGSCLSYYSSVDGQECQTDSDCKIIPVVEPCKSFQLKKCNDESPVSENGVCKQTGETCWPNDTCDNNAGDGEDGHCCGPVLGGDDPDNHCVVENADQYCFTDMECGADKILAGAKADCEDDMEKCLKYCTTDINVIDAQNKCAANNGQWYFWNGACIKGYFTLNNSACGSAKTVSGTDQAAVCHIYNNTYPSNSVETFYENKDAGNIWDISETALQNPPTVAGFVNTQKSDEAGNPLYAAAPDKLTVSTPDFTALEGDVVGFDGQLDISLKFYAWADDDQMPIRSVTVDWGDSKTLGPLEGLYQNHKPRCQRSAGEELGVCNKPGPGLYYGYACSPDSDECDHLTADQGGIMKCWVDADCDYDSDAATLKESCKADRFGDTVDACKEGYFNYKHMYMCQTISGVPECGTSEAATASYCQTEVPGQGGQRGCRFKPAVQIKDNWGWCNADHDAYGDAVDEDGYYDDSGNNGYDDCDLKYSDNKNAAEYYDGFIYVIP